jgi:hypothetical protein
MAQVKKDGAAPAATAAADKRLRKVRLEFMVAMVALGREILT